jgi:integrase
MNMKLSLFFYPKRDKTNTKTGKIPMYMRIILNREKAEMRLNVELQEADLLKWDEATMRFTDRNMSANAYLNELDKSFEDFRHHNATKLSNYNAKTIRDQIMGLDAKPCPLIIQYIDKYYDKAIAPNAQLAEGTKRNYRKAFKHLRDFLMFRKSKTAILNDLNVALAYEFRDYLLGSHPDCARTGMKEPSALDNIKRLRTVFDRAVDEELISSNPFKKIKLKSKSKQRYRLDINQVRLIYQLDLREFPTQQLYKDMFLFSVFTGLAYADASNLKQTDINKMKDGNYRLFLKRKKTDVITEMVLPKQAVAIVEKYKSYPEIEITGNVLPKRSNKEVNVQLKVLANMVNIPVKLSTHICRHTFRQLLAEADIYEMGVIKRMMGHSRNGEIDGIYYAVTETRLLEAKRKFELYLENTLIC